jgi:large subunit ribosomal protein L28e
MEESNTDEGNRNRIYRTVANQSAKRAYRADLRSAAVERVSAVRRSQRVVKASPEPKLRGNKAKKAAAAEEN